MKKIPLYQIDAFLNSVGFYMSFVSGDLEAKYIHPKLPGVALPNEDEISQENLWTIFGQKLYEDFMEYRANDL